MLTFERFKSELSLNKNSVLINIYTVRGPRDRLKKFVEGKS